MKIWTDDDHVGKVVVSLLDKLTASFHIHNDKPEDEKDYDLIIKLSSAAGYQAQLYSGLKKSHEFARRLQAIEKALRRATPEDFAMAHNPVLLAESEQQVQDEFK